MAARHQPTSQIFFAFDYFLFWRRRFAGAGHQPALRVFQGRGVSVFFSRGGEPRNARSAFRATEPAERSSTWARRNKSSRNRDGRTSENVETFCSSIITFD